jgi:multiple sugar transport system permease protein/raffinose/stachyose/melibiose transport system permease protein
MNNIRFLIKTGDLYRHIVLIVLLGLMLFPFVITFIISGKDIYQFNDAPLSLTLPFHWSNYHDAWQEIRIYLINSVIISGVSVIGVVIFSVLSSYAFARFKFPGSNFLYYAIISLLMIPGVLTLIPSFMLVKNLGLLNTRWVLLLPYISGGQVFAIFILKSFFSSIPTDYFDAARIDGANELQVLRHVVLPLSQSIIGTVAVMNLLGTWNDLIWPLVTLQDQKLYTLTVGLYNFRGMYYTVWGALMAGYIISSIPLLILFIFTSRLFIEGLSSGAIKM